MKNALFITLCALLPLFAVNIVAQTDNLSKYLQGAVPVKNGIIVFEKEYKVPGKNRQQIFSTIRKYVEEQLVNGENSLEQSRIIEADSTSGTLAASIEEWMYFKRKAWVTDCARFFYQLNFHIDNEIFKVEMLRLRYIYEEDRYGAQNAGPMLAEDWITDEEAIKKNGRELTKLGGKFRRFTIDRKDQIFDAAAKAAGAKRKVKKVIEVEE